MKNRSNARWSIFTASCYLICVNVLPFIQHKQIVSWLLLGLSPFILGWMIFAFLKDESYRNSSELYKEKSDTGVEAA